MGRDHDVDGEKAICGRDSDGQWVANVSCGYDGIGKR